MSTIDPLLKPYEKSIRQSHSANGNYVVEVLDDKTRKAVEQTLAKAGAKHHVTVAASTVILDEVPEASGDKISILYYGTLLLGAMEVTTFGKVPNHQFLPRFIENLQSQDYYEPVILDKNLRVIDGEQRIAIAQANEIRELPVIVTDATELQGKFLRLALNKSNELQRWLWEQVDEYLEAHPELSIELEKMAIFGERILPESYFGATVTGYEIHADTDVKSQQSFYKQEYGLARWATEKRERIEAELAKKKKPKKEAKANTQGLFGDLFASEGDSK